MSELDFEIFREAGDLDDIAVPAQSNVLFGHLDTGRFLVRAVRQGTLHHGLLLQGERGIGKATLVYHLANYILSGAINTQDTDDRLPAPDVSTATWRQIAQNAHPNVLRITRPKNDAGTGFKSVITVDEVRRVGRFLSMSAGVDLPRIVIIDAANDMNTNAANAILKMLEEPPVRTHFFLITHGAGGILPTIRSRTQSVKMTPIHDSDLVAALNHHGFGTSDQSQSKAAALAGGSVRRAMMMAQFGGDEIDSAIGDVLMADPFDVQKAHKLAEIAAGRGADIARALIQELLADRIRQEAKFRASANRIDDAAALARLDDALTERARIATAYNLDVRQETLVVLAQAHTVFRALAA